MKVNSDGKQNFKIDYLFVKQILGLLISLCLLILIIPVCAFFALLIRLESKGNPIFVQDRVGKDGKIFKIYKLRSMKVNAEDSGYQWAIENDPRITRVGKFIRRTRIDELPQIINIIKGDMNIIGPRPERPEFVAEFLKEIPDFNERLKVKPGITGWAQINGGYHLSPSEKLELDKYYIKHIGFCMDAYILIKTIPIILTGDGAL